jgi:hypothetical protein
MIGNFRKYSSDYFDQSYKAQLPYDINSVMHYGHNYFSKNRKITLRAKNGKQLGCRHTGTQCPTNLDIKKINVVYNCGKKSELNGIYYSMFTTY